VGADATNMVPALAQATGMSEADVQTFMASQFPAMMQLLQGLPQMQEDFNNLLGLMGSNVEIFEQVPAGLEHYEPLVVTLQEQRPNYDKAASMPDFRAFTWVFLIPGIALVIIAATAILSERKRDSTAATPES
jgi:hypothetical protein